MDSKKRIREIREELDKLEASLEEKLPFQEELDDVLNNTLYKIVVEARCGKVVLKSTDKGNMVHITANRRYRGNGRVGFQCGGAEEKSGADISAFGKIFKLAEAIADCHDC